MNVGDERDVDDQVINHIFGCGMTIAAILGRPDTSDEVAKRLLDVIEELDLAVSAIRRASFAAALTAHGAAEVEAVAQAAAIVAASATIADARAPSSDAGRRLSRLGEDAFAYAMHGHDFYRASDHVLWAHESEGLLLSARTGTPFARRDGHVFFDIESNVPLYYEDGHAEPVTG